MGIHTGSGLLSRTCSTARVARICCSKSVKVVNGKSKSHSREARCSEQRSRAEQQEGAARVRKALGGPAVLWSALLQQACPPAPHMLLLPPGLWLCCAAPRVLRGAAPACCLLSTSAPTSVLQTGTQSSSVPCRSFSTRRKGSLWDIISFLASPEPENARRTCRQGEEAGGRAEGAGSRGTEAQVQESGFAERVGGGVGKQVGSQACAAHGLATTVRPP